MSVRCTRGAGPCWKYVAFNPARQYCAQRPRLQCAGAPLSDVRPRL